MLGVGNLQKMKDILGKEVASLIDVYRCSGIYEFEFNTNVLSSGVYFYQLEVGNFVQTKKMVLLNNFHTF
jgi:hypothetical protein